MSGCSRNILNRDGRPFMNAPRPGMKRIRHIRTPGFAQKGPWRRAVKAFFQTGRFRVNANPKKERHAFLRASRLFPVSCSDPLPVQFLQGF